MASRGRGLELSVPMIVVWIPALSSADQNLLRHIVPGSREESVAILADSLAGSQNRVFFHQG